MKMKDDPKFNRAFGLAYEFLDLEKIDNDFGLQFENYLFDLGLNSEHCIFIKDRWCYYCFTTEEPTKKELLKIILEEGRKRRKVKYVEY